jgi:prepilin-type N-terminal cleavage/methylation domain-containing protein
MASGMLHLSHPVLHPGHCPPDGLCQNRGSRSSTENLMPINHKTGTDQQSPWQSANRQEFASAPTADRWTGESSHGEKMISATRNRGQQGFSLVEMMVVVAISVTLSTIAIMNYGTVANYLRIVGDMRNLNGVVAQAKMNAASGFTQGRAYADLAQNTYHLEIWNKAGNGGAGCWQTVGDTANACTVAASPVQRLSQGDVFGFDKITAPPPNTQAAIAQAAQCNDSGGTAIPNSSCIVFNSRGIPIKNNVPDGSGAFYLNNGKAVFGLTTALTGFVTTWTAPDLGTGATWVHP